MSHEVFQDVAFPFDEDQFPHNLCAVVQTTVLNAAEPARVVIHDGDNDWLVGDGVNDPTLPGASVVACIRHIADQDETVAELASLPIGHIAERDDVGSPWRIGVHKYPDE
ncbi:hypothetical protein ABZ780_13780 [Micromonospora sp. NPDC047467]|uniref:hypothetical protein n=1 Tax=Micromonospora sp. NPDC047467 TaxID=3154814 RepID=UPI0033F9AA1A